MDDMGGADPASSGRNLAAGGQTKTTDRGWYICVRKDLER